MRKRRVLAVLATVLFAAIVLPAGASAHGNRHWKTVASGLDNPRGIVVDAAGRVLVAEAGKGGAGPCMEGAEGGMVCLGRSGSITRIWHGHQKRIVTGLPSIAAPDGTGAIGPSDVGIRNGRLVATIGLGADPNLRDGVPSFFANRLDTLLGFRFGHSRAIADIGDFEIASNPDGGAIDSNPNSVVARRNGWAVADAGGNALLWVDKHGHVSTLAVFPDATVPGTTVSYQAVPTSVVVGPDGAYYVGQLTGFPFPVGQAKVWRVVPGQAPTVYASGFTNIIDLAFRGRTLYVLEIAHNSLLSGDPTGALIKVGKNGSQQIIRTTGLDSPGGMAVGKNGAIYISNHGRSPGIGEVLRYTP